MQTLAVTTAYLIYDLVCCQFDKNVKIDNAVHHLVTIIGLGAGLAHQRVFITRFGTSLFSVHYNSLTSKFCDAVWNRNGGSIMDYGDIQSISALEGDPQRAGLQKHRLQFGC